MMNRIGRERGCHRAAATTSSVEAGPDGELYVGAPETGGEKDFRTVTARSGLSRFVLKYSNGALPHDALMRSIELYGKEVMPRVRRTIAEPAVTR